MPEGPASRRLIVRRSRRAQRRYQQALQYFLRSFWGWLPGLPVLVFAQDGGFLAFFLSLLSLGWGLLCSAGALLYLLGAWWAACLFRHRVLAWHWRQGKLLAISVLFLLLALALGVFVLATFFRWEIPLGSERQTFSLGDNAFDTVVIGLTLLALALALALAAGSFWLGLLGFSRFFGFSPK